MQETDQGQKEETKVTRRTRRTVPLTTVVLVSLLIAVVAFVGGTRAGDVWAAIRFGDQASLDLGSVQSLYRTLRERYDGELDTAKLIEGAKHGLVEATGDPYTVYFTADEAKEFFGDLEGTFEGIGAELARRDDKLTIVSTIDGSPAAKSGLKPLDVIAAVNDTASIDWPVEKAVSEIRGEKGTTVKLTVIRGTEAPRDVTITRDTITDPSVKTEVTADNVGILRISRFGETDTVRLARQAAREFKDRGVKGVVVDLRGNGGGYLTAAQGIAGLWLKNQVVVTERRGGVVVDTLRSGSSPILQGVPTVVLVDGGSASASEIVAGALSDNGAAKLVGTKTFGKGSVQAIETLSDGGQLKVTTAKWFTPNGKNISKEGIAPDVEVSLSDADIASGNDPQRAKALELLK